MGVTCVLVPIEHHHGVVAGTSALQAAIAGDLRPLRRVVGELLTTPREVDELFVASRRARLAKLEALNAPPIILQSEVSQLSHALGEGRDPGQVERADRDELERLLRLWSRHPHVDLDKAWDLIHFFADAGRRRRDEPVARGTLIDQALYGQEPAPLIINGYAGYNAPERVIDVARALESVDPSCWSTDLFAAAAASALPYVVSGDGDDEDVEYARYHFESLRRLYTRAARLGLGVGISYG